MKLHPVLNGIDYLEVLDKQSDPYEERQTTLYLHFLKTLNPGELTTANVLIKGGESIRNVAVIEVFTEPETSFLLPVHEEASKVLVVKVNKAGDFSNYSLCLVLDRQNPDEVPEGFDHILSSVDFSFKVACPNDFDCKPVHHCSPLSVPPPEINYLAKDYSSFRQLMLDHISLLAPDWKERNPADIGIVLVELLAYMADYLSYRQDAIATEAYLGTARKRISIRRHARLVDYFMHDGCNARVWVQIRVGPKVNGLMLKKEGPNKDITRLLTRVNEMPQAFRLDSLSYERVLKGGTKAFELMHDITLYTEHNEIKFYTWDKKNCCLPQGATRATLSGHFPSLVTGQVLILAEVFGPLTGQPQDADPTYRHPVKLTRIKPVYDTLHNPSDSPSSEPGLPVTEIEWDTEDALPFPLCISNQNMTDISVAWGNIVLADHGLTKEDVTTSSLYPNEVPVDKLEYVTAANSEHNFCQPTLPKTLQPCYEPQLGYGPLTFAASFESQSQSALGLMQWDLRSSMPAIKLREAGARGDQRGNPEWKPQRDLLNSISNTKAFVVETEANGTSYLRFGDGKQGERPESRVNFMATYRVGNGKAGNIGAGTLTHIATNNTDILAIVDENFKVWNPLPAQGGLEAETIEEVRQFAPEAFRTQKRAVTPTDYETFAQRCNPDVQRAAATFRWTGSWKTVFLTVDRLEGQDISANFELELRNCLEQYRMAGFDLEVDSPLYVSLEIEIIICVNPNYFASDVKQALLEVFSKRTLPDGILGVFHPDNFSFGQPVYLSRLYAAAQATQGVDSVRVTKFRRQGDTGSGSLHTGKMLLGRREIARCDNDRNFRERGVFNLIMKGGR